MSILFEIDVVILSLNRVDFTLEAVKSVKRQVGVNPKVWLVDQGSNSSTLNKLRSLALSDKKIFLEELESNRGVAEGRNIGNALGKAEYIFSLDNDAELKESDTLQYLIRRLDKEPTIAVIATKIENYYSGDLDYGSWAYPRSLLHAPKQEFKCARFTGGSCCIRREALNETMGYDENLFFYWEELDLSYQLIENGHHLVYDPSRSVMHKVAEETRISWNNDRYFFLVRNALYLEWKYYRNLIRFIPRVIGYLVKGIINRVFIQSLKALIFSITLIIRLPKNQRHPLGKEAKQYIYENDEIYRGSLLNRFYSEVLEKLPK